MPDFSEANATDLVLDRMSACDNPRLKEVMTSVVKHLHAVIREVEPTIDEWMAAIGFLTRTGQMCDDRRQEFILLSDTLGVSMLVDAINHRKPSGTTESTVLGPFHVADTPRKEMGDNLSLDLKGEPVFVSGRVLDADGSPVEGATLDIWQTSGNGLYDTQDPDQPKNNLRGLFTTGADGRYFFRSVRPMPYSVPTDGPVGKMLLALGRHPMRPAHIHVIVGAPGYEPVTTHLFIAGDEYLDSDAVFGVKEGLIIDFVLHDDEAGAKKLGLGNPFYTVEHDLVLARPSSRAGP